MKHFAGMEEAAPAINASRVYTESPLYQNLQDAGLTKESGIIQSCAVNQDVLYSDINLLEQYKNKLDDPFLLARGALYPELMLYRSHVLNFLNQCT